MYLKFQTVVLERELPSVAVFCNSCERSSTMQTNLITDETVKEIKLDCCSLCEPEITFRHLQHTILGFNTKNKKSRFTSLAYRQSLFLSERTN